MLWQDLEFASFILYTMEGIDGHPSKIKKRFACCAPFDVAIPTNAYTLGHSKCWFDRIIKLRPQATDPEFCCYAADDPGTRVHDRCR